MEGLIPLVYKAIVEYRNKASSRQVTLRSFFFVTVVDDQLHGGDSGRWCYAPSPPASAAHQLVSPLLRSAPRRHRAVRINKINNMED
uniref:Uncharacterized protein n=1 Tax=Oryza sativa subsp. japonica TaxID=39947 RepID=Q7XIZ2_ORYSJ|nr:unknown protein [Oryza sativa Japonica Group]BAC82912.1 unknown protein [Oryza sativa Japonica Group]